MTTAVASQIKDSEIVESIKNKLNESPNGLTINELANVGVSRETLEKNLQYLLDSKEIYEKVFGVTRVFFPNNRAHYLQFSKIQTEQGRTFWMDLMSNEYGKYVWVSETKKTDDGFKKMGAIIIPIDKVEEFVEELINLKKSKRTKEFVDE